MGLTNNGIATPVSTANGGTGLSTSGTSGNVLTSNGSVWTSTSSSSFSPVVVAYGLTNSQSTTSQPILIMDTLITDSLGVYSTSTGLFTVPAGIVNGVFQFSLTANSTLLSNLQLVKNGSVVMFMETSSSSVVSSGVVLYTGSSGDTFNFLVASPSGNTFTGGAVFLCSIGIIRVK